MLDSFTSDNFRDFGPRYQDTYGFLQTPGQPKRLVYIADNDERAVYFRMQDGGMNYHAIRDTGVQFEFIQVNRGFFMGASGKTYLLTRVPARQWKRGIGTNNTSVQQLTAGGLDRVKLSITSLTDIYVNPIKVDKSNINKFNIFPLSRHFAICESQLYFYNANIGTVDKAKGTITLNNYIEVKQELTDVINRNGLSDTYKVQTNNG